ncbi:hypothetical protein DRO58_04675, partial [Candidatus Bathyarchaeota archaeon]
DAKLIPGDGPIFVAPAAHIGPGCVVRGPAYIGAGVEAMDVRLESCVVEKGCRLMGCVVKDSTVMEYSRVMEGAIVTQAVIGGYCLLGPNATVCGEILDGNAAVLGDFSTVSPGSVFSGPVKAGPFTNVSGFCDHDIPAFISRGGSRLSLDEALKICWLRVGRWENRIVSDYELNLVKKIYKTVRRGGRSPGQPGKPIFSKG